MGNHRDILGQYGKRSELSDQYRQCWRWITWNWIWTINNIGSGSTIYIRSEITNELKLYSSSCVSLILVCRILFKLVQQSLLQSIQFGTIDFATIIMILIDLRFYFCDMWSSHLLFIVNCLCGEILDMYKFWDKILLPRESFVGF